MTELTRESYVESELTKWKENYIVRHEHEFSLRAMLELQYQFKNTPDDHVKAKKDLIDTIQRILLNLRLKPTLNTKQFKVLVVVNNSQQKVHMYNMFQKMFESQIPFDDIKVAANGNISVEKIVTKNFEIRIETVRVNMLPRADYILNLTGNKEIDENFRSQNKL